MILSKIRCDFVPWIDITSLSGRVWSEKWATLSDIRDYVIVGSVRFFLYVCFLCVWHWAWSWQNQQSGKEDVMRNAKLTATCEDDLLFLTRICISVSLPHIFQFGCCRRHVRELVYFTWSCMQLAEASEKLKKVNQQDLEELQALLFSQGYRAAAGVVGTGAAPCQWGHQPWPCTDLLKYGKYGHCITSTFQIFGRVLCALT